MSQTTTLPIALEHFRHVADMIDRASVRAKEDARIRHERFNIFTTLLEAHDEVRLHTRFLQCLLDPRGFHDCGPLFLGLFFDTLRELHALNHEGARMSLELPQPDDSWRVNNKVTREAVGRIDILLEHTTLFGVAIENKIYAAEQKLQIARYADYMAGQFGTKALVLYLTRHGDKSATSEGRHYLRISYADHILAWLDKCLCNTCHIVPINQVLLQYREVVRQLTGRTLASETMKAITKYVYANPDLIRYRAQLNEAIDATRADFLDRLAEAIIAELVPKGYTIERQGRFSQFGSALLLTPLASSPLHRLPAKIWVEQWKQILIGIKFPAGYKQCLSIPDQNLVLEMHRILSSNTAPAASLNSVCNDAWPAGCYTLINLSDDSQLAELVTKPLHITASELSDVICSRITLLETAFVEASSGAPTSPTSAPAPSIQ